MDVFLFSKRYFVRKLETADVAVIYALCRENPLYYRYCPPFVTEESIIEDMKALPPRKELSDKFYVGCFDGEKLIAVMDFIRDYPAWGIGFIGFFMTDVSVQRAGTGSGIIRELCGYMREIGFREIRLGWVKGNPQAEHFWHKNGFTETGRTYDTEQYKVIVARRAL